MQVGRRRDGIPRIPRPYGTALIAAPGVAKLRDWKGGVSLGRLYPDAPELGHALLVAASECTTPEDIETLGRVLEEVCA